MNKRIRELAEQAGFQYIKDERIGWAGNYNASLPKFAELIVKECCQKLENDGMVEVAMEIKEHFGIKP